jgi:competence protein ComEC
MKVETHAYKKKIQGWWLVYGKVFLVLSSSVIIVVSAICISKIISPHELRVSFLDIGQGDAVLIQTPSGHSMLIDGGPDKSIIQKLDEQMNYFDHDIDVMVTTHPDADHVTGLIPVLEKYNVHTIVTPPIKGHTEIFNDLEHHITNENADVRVAHTGDMIDFQDGVVATILYPPKNYHEKKNDTNDASVSMEIKYGSDTFLLTGDLPSTEEGNLIRAGLDKNITVYKAGHHGSKYSSCEELLSYVHPEYAVISAGKNNRYGHPNPETVARLQKYSKEIISTIDRGTITFLTDGNVTNVRTSK